MKPKAAHNLAGWKVDAAGVIVLAALTALAYVIILQPMAKRQGELAQLRGELATTRNQVATVAASRAALDARLTRIRGEIDASPVNLEPAAHLNRRIARIVELASGTGMIIHETRSGEIVDESLYRTVPVEISGNGRYSRCAEFLHDLRDALPDVEVYGFELSGNPAHPEAGSTFRFDLAWYAAAPTSLAAEPTP